MKTFNYWYLSLVLLLSLGCYSCAQNKITIDLKEDEKLIEFTTDRFTLPNLHVTPDGKNIIFDVLGDIYQVPIEGGKAEVLLQDNNWKRAGKLSPDGKTLAYVSDETGVFQIWTYNLNTFNRHVYDVEEFPHYPLYPYWSSRGQLLIPSKDGLRSYMPENDTYKIVRRPKNDEDNSMYTVNRRMTIGKSGKQAYYYKNQSLWKYDLESNSDSIETKWIDNRVLHMHLVSEDGKSVMYYKNNDSIWTNFDLIYLDLNNGEEKTIQTKNSLGFTTSLKYSFDFIENSSIILDKEGEIVRMDIETGEYEPIPIEVEVKKVIKKPLRRDPQYIRDSIITSSVLRNPITRKDLDTIYFGAFGKLHSYSKETNVLTEIYSKEDRFEVSPSLSPDGKYLAYTTWKDTEMGHVYVREIKTGKEYQLTKTSGRYINPAWSPDGTEIVFVADETEAKMGIPRQTQGENTLIYRIDLHVFKVFGDKGILEFNESNIVKGLTLMNQQPRRFYPVPVFNLNGESVFITSYNKEERVPVLIEVNLKLKEIIHENKIPFHSDEVVVSPNAKHIAFIFDETIWIGKYPYKTEDKINYHGEQSEVTEISLKNFKHIFEVAPSYLYWQDKHTLMWGSAEEVYTYDERTGRTEKIADIKVQKPRAVPKVKYALTNARVITMNKKDEIIEKGTILVKDNRIEVIGEVEKIVIPKSYKIFDLKGKTIIPGLIDVHAHYNLYPNEVLNQNNYAYKGNLAYGITTIYDPSVNVLDYREQAQMVEVGILLGPRVFASGNIIMNYPIYYDYNNLLTSLDADRILKSYAKLNVYGPIKEYSRKNRKHRKWLYSSAKKEGLTLTNHESNFTGAITRIIDGYTAIEHEIGSFPLQYDLIKIISKSGIHYTPTYMIRPGIKDIYVDYTNKEKEKLLKFNGEIIYHNYYGSFFEDCNIKAQDSYKNWRAVGVKEHERVSKVLFEIIKLGGKVSIGGHGNPLPGIGTHWELWFMTKGMSSYQALQAATINGAEKLDLQEEIGSIEKGKLADMLVLNDNPIKSIFNTTNISYTISNGYIYESQSLFQIYPLKRMN